MRNSLPWTDANRPLLYDQCASGLGALVFNREH